MTPAVIESIKNKVSPEEWEMRVQLAAAYRLVAHYGWDDLIFTHISARVAGEGHHFLINPYGFLFDEITASSLVKVDIDGAIVSETAHFINPAGFTIHSAIHAAAQMRFAFCTFIHFTASRFRHRKKDCFRFRKHRFFRFRVWHITITKALRSTKTKNRVSLPI